MIKLVQILIQMRIVLLCLFSLLFSQNLTAQEDFNRVIVLTDIEADPDDTQSLVRLLLYSNEIDIKGIIATTSCWLKNNIHPESIKDVIEAYKMAQPNLILHDKNYPEAQTLLSMVKKGMPQYGMLGVGEGKDSEGSDWIIQVLEEDDDRPLWISVWGGANTLAQALFKIQITKSPKQVDQLISKLRVYTISDQDDSGIWIRNNFPNLFYIVSPGDDYGTATWNAINSYIEGIDNNKISNSWIAKNIQQGHGPLGTIYPDVAWGLEGDTPAFLSLIPNGLNTPEHPEWGGWGGRYELYKPAFSDRKQGNSGVPFEAETRPIWTDANETFIRFLPNEYGRTVKRDSLTFTGNKVSLWRWRDDFQNDFAARMDWCNQSLEEANHPPIVMLDHPHEMSVKSGDYINLNARKSRDPDGDHLQFLWFQYLEAGTLKQNLVINPENLSNAYIRAPEVDEKETVHFIVKVTDQGSPALSRYARVIVTILP